MYARQHFEQRAFKKSRRLSTLEQSDNESRTRGSLKTRGDFHKKYCSALRKYRFCKPTFLDEFPEFDRRVVESLRQPLEEGRVSISRAKGSEIFPAEFMLIAALNPCPCGYRGDKTKECVCSPSLLQKYQRKISGPIIDRIDMWIEVTRIEHEKLSEKNEGGESTEAIKGRVLGARKAQEERYAGNERNIFLNSRMNVRDLEHHIALSDSVKETLNQAAKKLDLSARAYHRIIKLARTIADLERSEDIEQKHILEALQYRPKAILS